MTIDFEVLLFLGLWVFCVIDVVQTDEALMRNLAKGWWVAVVLLFPPIGPIAWLVAGRPRRDQRPQPGARPTGSPRTGLVTERPRRTTSPDDDPDFLRQLAQSNTQHEQMLSQWEQDLRERERRLRGETGTGSGTTQPPTDPDAPSTD